LSTQLSAEPKTLTLHLEEIGPLAALVAAAIAQGEAVALQGDLGAGKTTLARAIVRALLRDDLLEVTSPTFPIVQVYERDGVSVGHFDFYRLGSADDVEETGYRDILAEGALLIEWPERATDVLPTDRLEISLVADEAADTRKVVVEGVGRLAAIAPRIVASVAFLGEAGWGRAQIVKLHGDASVRRYFRLSKDGERALLMDMPAQPDGPRIFNGKSYGEVAHLAENVRPFIALDEGLLNAGLSAPLIHAADVDRGLALIEDLGDGVFGGLVADGADQGELWQAAVDALVHLRSQPVPAILPVDGVGAHPMPFYDKEALSVEVRLLLDWYWPVVKGEPCPCDVLAAFEAAWSPLFERLDELPKGWVLRDYHSPNLVWLPGREGWQRVGVIDFQDAQIGHAAYDLVSLLQDARIDVPEALEKRLLNHYITAVGRQDATFSGEEFRFAYALLGAQRNTKILGIFARLARRDHKTQYLRHLPRIWRYVERNLGHVTLSPLAEWYSRYLPPPCRKWPDADAEE
jgi:tRNA threonylcarbamoyl adenosine modification protein YjeE